MRAGFIGCGNMGGTLAAAAAKSIGGSNVITADHNPSKTDALRKNFGCVPGTARQIAETCDLIFIGVKPQTLPAAAEEIRDILAARGDSFVLVSMAAGVDTEKLCGLFGRFPVIRIMPNTAAAVGKGVILYCAGAGVSDNDEESFLKLMQHAGLCVKLEERKIDMGSAITGCGPAFVYLMMEATAEAGVRMGLTRDQAVLFSEQTFAGAAQLALETGKELSVLRAEVCSPGGSTIEGVAALEAGAARYVIMEAVDASYKRTKELGKQ